MRLVTYFVLALFLTNAMVSAKSVKKAVDAEVHRKREGAKRLKSIDSNPAPQPAESVVEKYYHNLGALAENCKGTVNPDKCIVCECPVVGVIICHRKRNCGTEKVTSARQSLSLVKVAVKEIPQLLSNPYLPQYEPEYYDE